jgi:hypothetical protein
MEEVVGSIPTGSTNPPSRGKRKAEKASEPDSCEPIERECFEKFSASWAPSHSSNVIRRLES